MSDDIQYVVRFPNGKFYNGFMSYPSQTDDLRYANKYSMDWQPLKDLYLKIYCETNNLTYKLAKVRTIYELVN